MTYLQVLNLIKDVALAQPNINSVVREFTDLNREDARYSAVVIQDRDGQREMINGQDYITYTWHLGYVDRLTYDESNRDDIYSTGMVVINNIVAGLRERFFPELEVTVPDRFTTFNQRFTASCAGVYVVLAVNMVVSDCADYQTDIYDKYEARFTENGHYHYVPEGRPVDEIDIYVEVPECKTEIERTVTINMNGQTVVTPPEGNVFSEVTVNTSVHPSTSLSKTYTSNGTYNISGEYRDGEVTVDVHPSTSLVETITSNGTVNYSGEWSGAAITVAVPVPIVYPASKVSISNNGSFGWIADEGTAWNEFSVEVDVHPSNKLVETITSNGTVNYSGEWTDASITVDVHPSVSLSETYTSNGTYSISGEYNGGEVTVSVPQKTEIQRTVTINMNGQTVVTPPAGNVFSAVTVNTSVHPSTSLSETYTSNGTYSISGEYSGGEVTVAVPVKEEIARTVTISTNGQTVVTPPSGTVFNSVTVNTSVHPSTSLSVSYTSNGTYSISGEYNGGEVTVSVPTTSVVTVTQSQYDALTVKDPNTIYLING